MSYLTILYQFYFSQVIYYMSIKLSIFIKNISSSISHTKQIRDSVILKSRIIDEFFVVHSSVGKPVPFFSPAPGSQLRIPLKKDWFPAPGSLESFLKFLLPAPVQKRPGSRLHDTGSFIKIVFLGHPIYLFV